MGTRCVINKILYPRIVWRFGDIFVPLHLFSGKSNIRQSINGSIEYDKRYYIRTRETTQTLGGGILPTGGAYSTDYNTRSLAFAINQYFVINDKAIEVLVFKGRKLISVNRSMATKPDFLQTFKRLYER